VRVAPAARLIHALHYTQELRLMIASIRHSLVSLMWALLLLGAVVVFYALALQQTVQAQIESDRTKLTPRLVEYYGSLPRSMLSVFLAISGGADWQDVVEPLEEISKWYVVAFSLFVAVLIFGLLNILAAIFVERSCLVRHNSAVSQIREILETTCFQTKGVLSAMELEDILHDAGFVSHLKLLSLDVCEVRGLYRLLDSERTGSVPTQDFMAALMRLTGNARSIDIATMYYENKRILALVFSLVKTIEDNISGPETPRHERQPAERGARPSWGRSCDDS